MMIRYLSPIALILWATCSTAAFQNSDFWFHDDGDTIFIDGPRGAPLHIDYIGAPLTKPLKVRVTPNNPKLKIAAPICTFTKKDDDCWLTVRLENGKQKVYGVNQFTVTEVGASQGVLNTQAASETNTVGFGVGVQGKDMPKPLLWASYTAEKKTGKVIAINGIPKSNIEKTVDYQAVNLCRSIYFFLCEGSSKIFTLKNGDSCYLDEDILNDKSRNGFTGATSQDPRTSSYLQDVTDPGDPIFNSSFNFENLSLYKDWISTCSAQGYKKCASNKWGSMTIGLANVGSTDLEGGLKAGQIEVLRDNSWGNEASMYIDVLWDNSSLALLQIQGSTDGSENWDAKAATPSILEIKSAPPCSEYLKGDPSVTYKVIADVYGPGSVTMSGGEQCVIFKVPKSEFTRCTGSGIKDRIYEVTAVPESGKTFKGWNSKGLCDDAKTTCRFPLTSEVSIQPLFW
jgi:hypothetical protein